MSEEKTEAENFWSLKAYQAEKEQYNDDFRRRSLLINILIVSAIILSFIGLILFPQILLPGLLLSGCLIAAQAMAGFAILAAISKFFLNIYHQGLKSTLRMMLFAPIDFFTQSFNNYPIATTLLVLGFVAIAIVLILSGTGVITVPVLTVFAFKSLELEIIEIVIGLTSDAVVICIAAMLCYLPTALQRMWNELSAEPIRLPDQDESTENDMIGLYQLDALPTPFVNQSSNITPINSEQEDLKIYKNSYILVQKTIGFVDENLQYTQLNWYSHGFERFDVAFRKIKSERPSVSSESSKKIDLSSEDQESLIKTNVIGYRSSNTCLVT